MSSIGPQATAIPESTEMLGADRLAAIGGDWGVTLCFPFFNYLRVAGLVRHPESLPAVVALLGQGRLICSGTFECDDKTPAGTVGSFTLSAVAPEGLPAAESCSLQIKFVNGSTYLLPWSDLRSKQLEAERAAAGGESVNPANNRFFEMLRSRNHPAVLEIGSRARSGLSRRRLFDGMEYVGLDIMEGENVDLVGDAHELSAALDGRRFDGIYSISTFEHLIMPWKAALEINRALKPGGVCFIHTHQALGMHHMPWDFWRFSDTAWHGIFNAHTGFEILSTHLDEPMLLVPTVYTDHWKGYEGSLGFATSSVLARKTGETDLTWDVPAREVSVGFYPD